MAIVETEQLAGDVTRLTLNRPDKANALDAEIVEALLGGIETACAGGTRLLVLAGAGRHFCAGFDLSDLDTISDGDLLHRFCRAIKQVSRRQSGDERGAELVYQIGLRDRDRGHELLEQLRGLEDVTHVSLVVRDELSEV